MKSHVIFYVISGEAEITMNTEKTNIRAGECLISEPAAFSMTAVSGVKILGIQISEKP